MTKQTETFDAAKMGGLRRRKVATTFKPKKRGLRDRLTQMRSVGAFKGKRS